MPHAVSRLRTARLARSAKPFLARGGSTRAKCEGCRLALTHCTCAARAERAHARGRVPADGRHRGAQADQHRLAGGRRRARHLRVRLGAHRGRSGAARAAGRSAVAAVRRVPGRVRGAGRAWCTSVPVDVGQAAAVHPAGRHLERGAQDVPQEPVPRSLAGAEPAAGAGVALRAAAFAARRPFLHQRGGRAVPGTRRRGARRRARWAHGWTSSRTTTCRRATSCRPRGTARRTSASCAGRDGALSGSVSKRPCSPSCRSPRRCGAGSRTSS